MVSTNPIFNFSVISKGRHVPVVENSFCLTVKYFYFICRHRVVEHVSIIEHARAHFVLLLFPPRIYSKYELVEMLCHAAGVCIDVPSCCT